VLGQKQSADLILFLMDGQIEVGYNHQYLLFEKGIVKAQDLSRQLVRKKSMKRNL